MDRQTGFTLPELLTVVAVIGILAAVVIPMATSFNQSTGIRADAKQVAADLWFARQRAIATSVPHSIEFDTTANGYIVFRDDGGGDPDNQANGDLDTGEQVVRRRGFSSGHVLTEVNLDPANSIIFSPRGMLWNGTTGGYITISTEDNRSRTVSIMASGMCRVS